MYLYHYYDKRIGPFKNLSDLTCERAEELLQNIKMQYPASLAAKRDAEYMKRRMEYEALARDLFLKKGGRPERLAPHYMVVEECAWLGTWYEESAFLKVSVEEFDLAAISFTYGDMHPTFSPRVNDGREYRKQLYTYAEILTLIEKYGLPQVWNPDGIYGPERYIEVQVWSDNLPV